MRERERNHTWSESGKTKTGASSISIQFTQHPLAFMESAESVTSAIKTCQAQVEKLKAEWQNKLEMYEEFVPDKRSGKLLLAKEGEATRYISFFRNDSIHSSVFALMLMLFPLYVLALPSNQQRIQ